MDIIKLLRESTTSDLDAFILGELAADTIEQLRLANTDLQMHFDYLKSEYDRMRSLGNDEGLKAVFKNGYDHGFANGYSSGNEEGLKAAFKNGYDNGYSTGYTMGYSEGLKETLYDGMPRLDDRGDNLDGN